MDPRFKIEPAYSDLIAQGYIKNPEKRPNILEYISHPVFKQLREKQKLFLEISMSNIMHKSIQKSS